MSTITTRAGKGSALTHAEVDANFTNLNTDKVQTAVTLTANYVTKGDGTNVVKLSGIYEDVSGKVGFGTSSPSTKVVISNAGAEGIELDYNGLIQSFNRSTLQYQPLYLDASVIAFRPAGVQKAIIDGSGNFAINDTSADYKLDVNGTFGFTPGSSVTPVDNGDVVFELTNNTTLTIKAKGSDGTVRSATVTLA